jgi:hypothetical protein
MCGARRIGERPQKNVLDVTAGSVTHSTKYSSDSTNELEALPRWFENPIDNLSFHESTSTRKLKMK